MERPSNNGTNSDSFIEYEKIWCQIKRDLDEGKQLDWSHYQLEGLSSEYQDAIKNEAWMLQLKIEGNFPAKSPHNHNEAPSSNLPRIDGYDILCECGRGGMGVVYKANDIRLNRFVALKAVFAEIANQKDVRARFLLEGQALARLDHPGIVRVYSANETVDGQLFLSMEYLEGETLAERITKAPLSPRDAAATLLKIAGAVAYAHKQDIIHRDLKPANILCLDNTKIKLIDFGLAIHSQASRITQLNTIPGTIEYMSPEQALNNTCTSATDVWALGIILFELITCKTPFADETGNRLATRDLILTGETPSLQALCPEFPEALHEIYLGCLKKNPAERFPVDELIRRLNCFINPTSSPLPSDAIEDARITAAETHQSALQAPIQNEAISQLHSTNSGPNLFPFLVGFGAFVIGLALWNVSDWVGCGDFGVKVTIVTKNKSSNEELKLGYKNQLNYGYWYLILCPIVFGLAASILTHKRSGSQFPTSTHRPAFRIQMLCYATILACFVGGSIYTEWEHWKPKDNLGFGWVQAESFADYAKRLRASKTPIPLSDRRFDQIQLEDGSRYIRVHAEQVILTEVEPANMSISHPGVMKLFVIMTKAWAGFWEGMAVCVSIWVYFNWSNRRTQNVNFNNQLLAISSRLFWISILGGIFYYLRFVANVVKGSFGLSDLDKLASLVLLIPGLIAVALLWDVRRNCQKIRMRYWVFFGFWILVWAIVLKILAGYFVPYSSKTLKLLWKTWLFS